uniref:Uncharacterized protein n=1 Tax=Caenorhabditis japonica TaxID=281687 RepID=A0A8R1I1M4_CAEJA
MEMKSGRNGQIGRNNFYRGEAEFSRREVFYQPDDGMDGIPGHESGSNESLVGFKKTHFLNRPRLSSSTMLKGLVERTENYNKTVDRKVLTDSRIAFEEEHLIGQKGQDVMAKEMEQLAVSNQHIPTRGRGDSFGKMRSSDNGFDNSMRYPSFSSHKHNNIPQIMSINSRITSEDNFTGSPSPPAFFGEDGRKSASPSRTGLIPRSTRVEHNAPRHQFDPSTAYNGRVVPDYRFSYQPDPMCATAPPVHPRVVVPSIPATVSPVRPGQRYQKRPDIIPPTSSQPKPLSHNYYNIKLYGKAQEERTAQRIEKTVRQTEMPPQRF